MPFLEVLPTGPDTGGLIVNAHEGQLAALKSPKRTILVLAGARGGKTVCGPIWLHNEMLAKGPGDYLVAGPDFQVLDKGAGPEIRQYFGYHLQYGHLNNKPLQFVFSEQGCKALWGHVPPRQPRIIFGHADDPQSLQAMTVKAAWLDEAGQKKFKLDSWRAIQLRVSVDQGRIFITTTPYEGMGWVKKELWDVWDKAGRNHPEIDVIQFKSTMNPAFSQEEYDRAALSWPRWQFLMYFHGEFTKPAGLIYDCVEPIHFVPPFRISNAWHRYCGLDFGGVNTAAVVLAEEQDGKEKPTGRYFVYRDYLEGGKTAKEHARAIIAGEPKLPHCVGGSHSEGQWRHEFAAAGLGVREPPIKEVEVGIQRVYGAFKRMELFVFDNLDGLRGELETYSRELNSLGESTEKIADKETFHRLDALRYIVSHLKGGKPRTVDYKLQMVR